MFRLSVLQISTRKSGGTACFSGSCGFWIRNHWQRAHANCRLSQPWRGVKPRIAGHRRPCQVVGNGPVVHLPSGPDGNCHQAADSAEDQRRPIASNATCHFAHRECGGSSQGASMSPSTGKRRQGRPVPIPAPPVSKACGLAFLPRSERLCWDHIPVTVAA